MGSGGRDCYEVFNFGHSDGLGLQISSGNPQQYEVEEASECSFLSLQGTCEVCGGFPTWNNEICLASRTLPDLSEVLCRKQG